MRIFLQSSIVFRLWLALSVVATAVIIAALGLYVWLAIDDDIAHVQMEAQGKIDAVVLAARRFNGEGAAPDPLEYQTASKLGILKMEILSPNGLSLTSFDFVAQPITAPTLDAATLSGVTAPMSRTLRIDDTAARLEQVTTGRVIAGGNFGEERLVPISLIRPGQPGYLRIIASYPGLTDRAHNLIIQTSFIGLVITTAILLAMWPFLLFFVSRPLSRYSELAMDIAIGKPVRMPGYGRGELGQLGRAVNSMADALEHRATVDALTGLYNLRHLSSHLEAMINDAEANDSPLSIIVGDLDNLKKVNDTFGHQAGDEVLIAVSKAIKGWAGHRYTCWRLGGDEFLIALPNTSLEEGIYLADEMGRTVEALAVPIAGSLQRPSISVGVATYPLDEVSSGALMGIADRRMYAHKAARHAAAVMSEATAA